MKHKGRFWLGLIMLAIGALGIYYEIRTSIELGKLAVAVGIWVLTPFLVPGTLFIMRGLGKESLRLKFFWPGIILLYIGLLILLVMSAGGSVIYAAIISIWFIVLGTICISLGVKNPERPI